MRCCQMFIQYKTKRQRAYILFTTAVVISNWLQLGVQVTALFSKNGRNSSFAEAASKATCCEQHLLTVILNI